MRRFFFVWKAVESDRSVHLKILCHLLHIGSGKLAQGQQQTGKGVLRQRCQCGTLVQCGVHSGADGVHAVCPAVDAALDESAALAALPQDTLARLLLPLGEFTAADVQEMAQDFKVNGTV